MIEILMMITGKKVGTTNIKDGREVHEESK